MKKILISTSNFSDAHVAPLKNAGYEVITNPHKRRLTEAEITELLVQHQPEGLIAGVEPLTAAVFAQATALKVVSRCGTGLDSVDLTAAQQSGIKIYNTPDAPVAAVAELTIGLMLNVLRHISSADRSIRENQWRAIMGNLLAGKIVGLIGHGRIGRRVAQLAEAFGASCIYHDPYCQAGGSIDLELLLSRADIISLHIPYSKDSHHLINKARIERLKPEAILINVARGGLVDEDALVEALSTQKLRAAGLDVFENEPYQGPLKDLDNVVLTAHMGSYAKEARTQQEVEAVTNLLKHMQCNELISEEV